MNEEPTKLRRSLYVPGIHHGQNPIPSGVVIGGFLFSGGVSGQDPETSTVPENPALQAELAFANVRRLLEAAGGTTANIAHVTVYLKDMAHRELINNEWLKLFPDEDDRPTRHTLKAELSGVTALQLQVMAVLN
jgi:2-iminobutanoate/2-iminopropanoate deaminase